MHTWKRTLSMQIVTRDEGAVIGHLNDFQFDLADHRIYGWRLKGVGMFAPAGGVSTEALLMIGRDVAFVRSEKSVEWSNAGRNLAEGRAWAGEYRGTSVVDQRGRSMGSVQDFVFDEFGARLTGLILQGNLLLPLDDQVRTGPAAVVAQDLSLAIAVPEADPDDKERWWDWIKDVLGARKEGVPGPNLPQLEDQGGADDPVTWPPSDDEGKGKD
jgi:sporulation protein YlmC with PRC-barrel domain